MCNDEFLLETTRSSIWVKHSLKFASYENFIVDLIFRGELSIRDINFHSALG